MSGCALGTALVRGPVESGAGRLVARPAPDRQRQRRTRRRAHWAPRARTDSGVGHRRWARRPSGRRQNCRAFSKHAALGRHLTHHTRASTRTLARAQKLTRDTRRLPRKRCRPCHGTKRRHPHPSAPQKKAPQADGRLIESPRATSSARRPMPAFGGKGPRVGAALGVRSSPPARRVAGGTGDAAPVGQERTARRMTPRLTKRLVMLLCAPRPGASPAGDDRACQSDRHLSAWAQTSWRSRLRRRRPALGSCRHQHRLRRPAAGRRAAPDAPAVTGSGRRPIRLGRVRPRRQRRRSWSPRKPRRCAQELRSSLLGDERCQPRPHRAGAGPFPERRRRRRRRSLEVLLSPRARTACDPRDAPGQGCRRATSGTDGRARPSPRRAQTETAVSVSQPRILDGLKVNVDLLRTVRHATRARVSGSQLSRS